jgi:hypothetical protein
MMSAETDARAALAICQCMLLLLIERHILNGEDVRQVLEDAADTQRQSAIEGQQADGVSLEAVAQTITDIANSVAAAVPAERREQGSRSA